jgi:anhydro-N-acetylmuramic acid kinase
MKKKVFTALGLMTGTSMDGIDLSMIRSDGFSQFSCILNKFYEFDHELQEKLMTLRDSIFSFKDLEKYSNKISTLEKEITLFHGNIIKKTIRGYDDQIDLIGFHGQTIFHDSSQKHSKQLGDGKLLSQITKKIVVNNFREQDLINGGQGAPLTPIFHQLIYNLINQKKNFLLPLNIINIGGITNMTQIFKDGLDNSNLYAYDIGPGNCLIDEWVRKNSKNKFDEDGKLAKSGKVNDLILNQAIDNFSSQSYEKSLDIKNFDISFVKGLSLEDGCATLTKFTAYLIVKGIETINLTNNTYPEINLICGGGRKNNFLIENIVNYFENKKIRFKNIDDYDLNGDFIESQAFGYLSIRTFLDLPISFPRTTRCKSPTVGGTINKNF